MITAHTSGGRADAILFSVLANPRRLSSMFVLCFTELLR